MFLAVQIVRLRVYRKDPRPQQVTGLWRVGMQAVRG